MIDKYFERKYTKWNIIDFLNECDIETFEGKIDHYLKSLRAIVDYEKGTKQDKARYLLDRYNKDDQPGPDYKEARNWEKRMSVRTGSSFHFHNSTVIGSSLGGNSGVINNIKFLKEKSWDLPKKNKESVYSVKKVIQNYEDTSLSSSSSSQEEPRPPSTPEEDDLDYVLISEDDDSDYILSGAEDESPSSLLLSSQLKEFQEFYVKMNVSQLT
ncbi:hypothetical protein C1646_774762 [Rhizophagus diaphanus]|nr:hypothetical protein C1646_774762 [Rhizophagus diaphanus] [Rhizophagus sp. MUCL 43196]